MLVCAAGVRGVAEEKVKETKRKSSLLSAHSVKCQDFVNVLNEFSKRIRYRIQVLRYSVQHEVSCLSHMIVT